MFCRHCCCSFKAHLSTPHPKDQGHDIRMKEGCIVYLKMGGNQSGHRINCNPMCCHKVKISGMSWCHRVRERLYLSFFSFLWKKYVTLHVNISRNVQILIFELLLSPLHFPRKYIQKWRIIHRNRTEDNRVTSI